MSVLSEIEDEMREAIPRVLSREPAKVVALLTGVTERTAENWCNAKNLPSAPSLMVLAREYPELRRMVLRWVDLETPASCDVRVASKMEGGI